MAESGLSIGFPTLQIEVGVYLGYGSDTASWDSEATSLVNRIIQSGIRQFYYPPIIDRVGLHSWSFLIPTATITTVADQWEYDLPDDFSQMAGNLQYDDSVCRTDIPVIGYGHLLALRSRDDESGNATVAAIRFKASSGTTGQRNELLLHSPPDDVYTLTYRYEAYNGALSAANPYPLGGMKYAETIISSCLAIAEARINGEKSIHKEQFETNLATAIASDRNTGAKNFGFMGDRSDTVRSYSRHNCNSNITYKNETW